MPEPKFAVMINRRSFLRYTQLGLLGSIAWASLRSSAQTQTPGNLRFSNWHDGSTPNIYFRTRSDTYTINWGGCSNTDRTLNAIEAAGAYGGDIFALTGDFIYIDGSGPQTYERYRADFLATMNRSDWQSVIAGHRAVIGVQDDHDYGLDGYAGADDGINEWAWNAFREVMPQPQRRQKRTYFSWQTRDVKFFMLDSRLYANRPPKQTEKDYPVFIGEVQWNWFTRVYQNSPQPLKVVILPISPTFADGSESRKPRTGGGSQIRGRGRGILRDFLRDQPANCLLLTSDRHACGHASYNLSGDTNTIHEFLAGPMGTGIRHTISEKVPTQGKHRVNIIWSNASETVPAPQDDACFGSLILNRKTRAATVKVIKHDQSVLYEYTLANMF